MYISEFERGHMSNLNDSEAALDHLTKRYQTAAKSAKTVAYLIRSDCVTCSLKGDVAWSVVAAVQICIGEGEGKTVCVHLECFRSGSHIAYVACDETQGMPNLEVPKAILDLLTEPCDESSRMWRENALSTKNKRGSAYTN